MSSILRKVENIAHPERREYYDTAGQGNTAMTDPSVPRTAAGAHNGRAPVVAGSHMGANMGPEYATTGHPRPHEHINATQGKHGYIQYGRSPASGPAPTTAGPHRHDFMNKLDPRVDSTADHRPVVANTNAHHSKIANVLDPRVDSSVANSPAVATTGSVHPTAGAGYTEQPIGHHHGAAAYETVGGRHAGVGPHSNVGTAHTGVGSHAGNRHVMDPTGPASKTAGPHRSNLLNKLDPTVDSRAGNMANVPGGPVASGANSGYPV